MPLLVLDLAHILAFQHAQRLSAQGRPDPRAQDRRVERLRQIVVDAKLDALRNPIGVCVTGISRWSGSLLMTFRTRSPFRSGIIRSSRTRLNFSLSISAIASFPPAAQVIRS